MVRKKVDSSNIRTIGYDPETRTLEVEFKTGKVYQYNPITNEAYNLLMNAESKGAYFHKNIKTNDRVTCTMVDD